MGAYWARNRTHFAPTQPGRDDGFWTVDGQLARITAQEEDVAAGRLVPLLVFESGALVAEVVLSGISLGSFRSASLGYGVAADRLRLGIATAAVGAACDIARDDLQLHRVQAGTLLDNTASQGVLRACGFERIGIARRYLAIAGAWRDHMLWQRTFDEVEAPAV
jgi:ribosomal-protein-alanine N-acetyltransferase